MSLLLDCQEKLLDMAGSKGYLTYDDIIGTADTFGLSISELDTLSGAIQLRGVLVYEEAPRGDDASEETEDFSRVNYEQVYTEIAGTSESLRPIVEQIKSLPTPQRGEISSLVKQNAAGNEFARNRLIALHLRTALKIALAMSKQFQYDIEDAVSAGFIGLCIAADKFDPNGFSAFQSYASLWVQQNIQRECAPVWMQYYYPVHYRNAVFQVLQHYEQGANRGVPTRTLVPQIAEELGIKVEDVHAYICSARMQETGQVELDQIVHIDDMDGYSLYNIFPGLAEGLYEYGQVRILDIVEDEQSHLMDDVETNALQDTIMELLEGLRPREREVLVQRYGLDGNGQKTLEEVGALFNLTRERIRQIEAKALKKLRHPIRRRRLLEFYEA